MDGFQILYGRPSVRQDPFSIFSLSMLNQLLSVCHGYLQDEMHIVVKYIYLYTIFTSCVYGSRMCSRISVVIMAWELNSAARLERALLPLFSISPLSLDKILLSPVLSAAVHFLLSNPSYSTMSLF
jgi:hypothetical protein